MADSATAARPKRKLPFKRTIARRKSTDTPPNGAEQGDDDDGVDLFRRVKDELPEVLKEQESRLRRQEEMASAAAAGKIDPDDEDVKRRKLSQTPDADRKPGTPRRRISNQASTPRSAFKSNTTSITLVDDEDDLTLDVKGKGKDIFGVRRSPKTKKTPPSTPSKGLFLDDDYKSKMSATPETPRSGAMRGPRTRAQRLLSPELPEVEILPSLHEDGKHAAEELSNHDENNDDNDLEILDVQPVEEEEEDDEFAEYVRRARERAEERERQAKIQLERGSQAKDSQETNLANGTPFDVENGSNSDNKGSVSEEAIITILVTSVLPGTKPTRMKRRLNQNLKLVRIQWALSQDPGLKMSMTEQFFLTWRGKRVYDETTPFNLGLRVEKLGQAGKPGVIAGAGGARFSHGKGLDGGGLHLEAWTEEAYQEYLAKKEKERRRLLGELDDNDEREARTPGSGVGGSDDPNGDGGAEEAATTKIILKAAKAYEPLKIRVQAHTTIEQIIAKFRSSRNVPEDEEISLFFDGEKLEDNITIQDTEIEDDDSIEVHIK